MSEQDAAAVEETPVVETPAAEPEAQPADDDAALEASIAEQTIEVPDSSAQDGKVKLVPLSAVTSVRDKLKDAKAALAVATEGSAKAQTLERRIDELSAQLAQLGPKAQAYDAAVAAQQQRPQQGPTPEDRAELEEIARDLDLYNADGTPNLERATRIRDREHRLAQRVAQQAVAPLAHHTVTQQSNAMLERAKNTAAPNGVKPDPATLQAVWARLDPALTATPDGAKQAWAVALGYTTAMQQAGTPAPRAADGKFAKADVPPPLYSEKAGGKDTASVQLSDKERDYIKREGITEAEYMKSMNSAPWLRR